MPLTLLKVPERGTVEISKAAWAKLAGDAGFWSLADQGIVSVEQGAPTTVRLKGGCYVGRAIIGDHTILQLEEKIPGALFGLIGHAARADFRIGRLPSKTSALGPLISLLVEQFSVIVSRYLSRGREFKYRRETRTGSLIGGKLNLTGTIRLRARGLRHLAQFEMNAVAFDTPLNRVILAALREVDRIHRLLPLDAAVVARCRALALFFADCRSTEVLFGPRAVFIKRAAEFEAEIADPLRHDLMALAGVLLSHESFESSHEHQRHSPRSWFLNLESLFEVAVRNLLARLIGSNGTVRNGRNVHLPIFAPGGARHQANPDFVIRMADRTCIVGDAKFKLQEERSDLYQLLVHAAAFDASDAFLVSPHDTFSVETLGSAKTGATVKHFTVNLAELEMNVQRLLSMIMPVEQAIRSD